MAGVDPGWGVASGFLAGTQEQQAIALGKQELALGEFKLQEAPVTLQKEQLALQVEKQSVQAHNQMLQMLNKAGGPQGTTDPISDAAQTMLRVGSVQVASGLPEEGVETISKATQMLDRQSEVAYRAFEVADKQAKFVEGMVASVEGSTNPEQAYGTAVATARMLYGEQAVKSLPPWNAKTTPLLIDQMKKAAEAHRTQAQQAYDRAHAQNEQVQVEASRALIKQREEAARLSADRADNLEKNNGVGGSALTKAKSGTVTSVSQALQTKFPGQFDDLGSPSAGYRTTAEPLALEVEALMKKIPGLTQPQAVERVINRNYQSGHLPFKPRAVRPGMGAENPAPIPRTSDGKVDVSKMVAGHYYPTPDGDAGVYVPGKGLVVPKDDSEDEDN